MKIRDNRNSNSSNDNEPQFVLFLVLTRIGFFLISVSQEVFCGCCSYKENYTPTDQV
jgi:hypothetical protein